MPTWSGWRSGRRRRPATPRWWYRGPFVRREVRLSVGTCPRLPLRLLRRLPLLASHRSEVNALAHINMAYLVLGVLLEIGALAAYTQLTHAVLPSDGPRRLRLFRINMSTLSLSHVSPGRHGPGGSPGVPAPDPVRRERSRCRIRPRHPGHRFGRGAQRDVLALPGGLPGRPTASTCRPATHGGQSQSGSILVIVAAGVGVVLLGAFGGALLPADTGAGPGQPGGPPVAGRIRFLDADRTTALVERLAERFAALMENRSLTRSAVGWAAANWLLDAASLWVFVAAFSHFISPVDLLMAYGLANILAAIPITPGGLGVVEFVLVSMITGFGPTAGPGPLRRVGLPGGELLAAHPLRRTGLRLTRNSSGGRRSRSSAATSAAAFHPRPGRRYTGAAITRTGGLSGTAARPGGPDAFRRRRWLAASSASSASGCHPPAAARVDRCRAPSGRAVRLGRSASVSTFGASGGRVDLQTSPDREPAFDSDPAG